MHDARMKVATALQLQTQKLLQQVGMPNALFEVAVREMVSKKLNENGYSEVEYLFSANKGFAPQPIRKVASGGELSRLLLCIKSQQADAGKLPTLIFDEIDAGISGEVALKVGEIMQRMARSHQLICITHLPQIASTAQQHFYIYKETKLGKTTTRVRLLEGETRVTEIAKMLGGDKVSQAALANARELLGE